MKPRALILGLAIAGCAGPTQPGTTPATSLYFKTLIAEQAAGSYFAAGPSTVQVLRSRSELLSFFWNHPSAVAPPQARDAFASSALPDEVQSLDFSKYEAIAFFDGHPKLATTARITAINDLGDHLNVVTERWAPDGTADDVNGRLHLVALARTDKLITNSPTVAGAIGHTSPGVAGSLPFVQPLWPAMPNPEVTLASLQARYPSTAELQITITQLPVSQAFPDHDNNSNFTPDSPVWVVTRTGAISVGSAATQALGVELGSSPDVVQVQGKQTIVISTETGDEMGMSYPAPPPPTTLFVNLHLGDTPHLGDALSFDVKGTPVPNTALELTITTGQQTLYSGSIPSTEVGAFTLPLDAAHLKALPDAPSVPLHITKTGSHGAASTDRSLLRL